MNIKVIVGNRPQFVKAAAIFRAYSQLGTSQKEDTHIQLIHTGQHYDQNMSEIFFNEMDLPKPDWYLGINELSHGKMTGRMIEAIEELLLNDSTDWVVVLGDTNSTIAGALAAVKLNVPVAHIEAGLRSFNRKMPEEINRVLTDHASDLLFTPTEGAVNQLVNEGIEKCKIHQVGDVMLDSFLYYHEKAAKKSSLLKSLGLNSKEYVLATVHREENTNDIARLEKIISGLQSISELVPVVFPIHPRTKKIIDENKISLSSSKLMVLEPVGYFDMICLESNAKAILTDSGGVQKESYFCKVPCITLRDETEWVELVENGFNQLASCEQESMLKAYHNTEGLEPNWKKELYGNGRASSKILDQLINPIES